MGGIQADSIWTPARIDALIRLFNDGLSASQIAGQLGAGITRKAVIGKVCRLGLNGRPQDASIWTSEMVARLKLLWAKNPSAVWIGAELGLTRHQVISKAFRLGLSERSKVPPRAPRPRRDYGGGTIQRIRSRLEAAPVTKVPKHHISSRPITLPTWPFEVGAGPVEPADEAPIAPVDDNIIPAGQRCTLFDLTEETCRWPIGTPGTPDFFFCGAQSVEGPYCPFHRRVAYQPVSVRRDRGAWR